jgi:hypothetical protein
MYVYIYIYTYIHTYIADISERKMTEFSRNTNILENILIEKLETTHEMTLELRSTTVTFPLEDNHLLMGIKP